MPDQITTLRIGTPGQSGANVTAAEKATYVTTSAANVFTNTQNVKKTSTVAFVVEDDAATDTLVIDTTNKEVELHNGADLRGFSDAGTTETFAFDGATGNLQIDGVFTVSGGRVVGDLSVWNITIDGGGVAITTGVKFWVKIPFAFKITAWEITADQSGSAVVDFWSDSYANFPPTVADTITTGEKPTLTAVQKNTDTSLNAGAGWTITNGNYLMWNVDSATTVTKLLIAFSGVRL